MHDVFHLVLSIYAIVTCAVLKVTCFQQVLVPALIAQHCCTCEMRSTCRLLLCQYGMHFCCFSHCVQLLPWLELIRILCRMSTVVLLSAIDIEDPDCLYHKTINYVEYRAETPQNCSAQRASATL